METPEWCVRRPVKTGYTARQSNRSLVAAPHRAHDGSHPGVPLGFHPHLTPLPSPHRPFNPLHPFSLGSVWREEGSSLGGRLRGFVLVSGGAAGWGSRRVGANNFAFVFPCRPVVVFFSLSGSSRGIVAAGRGFFLGSMMASPVSSSDHCWIQS